jgi:UDP-N-acetylglucosamine--N-acetylmuramyl-(pentapeptide) pyrophosphoryl-undecaprenol N-acetylglucosamine transferase
VPVLLHEQNAILGLANRAVATIAAAAAVSFPTTPLPRRLRVEVTGTPVRREVLEVPQRRDELRREALATFGLETGRTTILVTGGSLGALHLDRAVAAALPLLAARDDLQLLVLTGREHERVVADAVRPGDSPVVRTVPYLDRIELALALADLAVSRAGANTIHELCVCGVPTILVPYPHATGGHQEANARHLERLGAAEVLLDAELTGATFAARVDSLVDDAGRRDTLRERALGWAKPDADRRVADLVLEVATR